MNRSTLMAATVALSSTLMPGAAGAATDPVTKIRTGVGSEITIEPDDTTDSM